MSKAWLISQTTFKNILKIKDNKNQERAEGKVRTRIKIRMKEKS